MRFWLRVAVVMSAIVGMFFAPVRSAGEARRAKPATTITSMIMVEVRNTTTTCDIKDKENKVLLFFGEQRSFDAAKNPRPSEKEVPFSFKTYLFYLREMQVVDVEKPGPKMLNPAEINAVLPFLDASERYLEKELKGALKSFTLWNGRLVSATRANGVPISLSQKPLSDEVVNAAREVEGYCIRAITWWMRGGYYQPPHRLRPRKQQPKQQPTPPTTDLLTARAVLIAPRDPPGVLLF